MDQSSNNNRRGDVNVPYKRSYSDATRPSGIPTRSAPKYFASSGDDKRTVDCNRGRQGDEKLTAFKNYRKAKGLCFKCGEKWGPRHKCQSMSLHAMEEVWEFLSDEQSKMQVQIDEENDSGEDLIAILVQAMKGTEGIRTVRLRGFLAGQEVFMLVDSGSTNCFNSEDLASRVQGRQDLSNTILV